MFSKYLLHVNLFAIIYLLYFILIINNGDDMLFLLHLKSSQFEKEV